MKNLNKHTIWVFFMLTTTLSFAQSKLFTNELGVFIGPVLMDTDYYDVENLASGNIGYSVGVVHYMNFLCGGNCTSASLNSYFKNHFKVRNDFSYSRINLKNNGAIVDASDTSAEADRYRAMRGQTTLYQLGSALEYYPTGIRDFESGSQLLMPSISIGAQLIHHDGDNYSTLGFISDPNVLPAKYTNTVDNRPGLTGAILATAGTRIKLSPIEDIFIQARYQYFFSDRVEGITIPNSSTENATSIVVGYVYHIE